MARRLRFTSFIGSSASPMSQGPPYRDPSPNAGLAVPSKPRHRPGKLEGALSVAQAPFKLCFLHGRQNFLESRSSNKAHILEVVTRDQLWRADRLGRRLSQEISDEVVHLEASVARQAV